MFITYQLDGKSVQQAFQEARGCPWLVRHAGHLGMSWDFGHNNIWYEKRHTWSLDHDAAWAAAEGFATDAAVPQPPSTSASAIFI